VRNRIGAIARERHGSRQGPASQAGFDGGGASREMRVPERAARRPPAREAALSGKKRDGRILRPSPDNALL